MPDFPPQQPPKPPAGGPVGPNAMPETMAEEKPPVELDERQEAIQELHKGLVAQVGKYPAGLKSGGAHYVPTVDQTAQVNGIMCKNCVFFNESEQSCEIVEGTINETGVCRYWVIPDDKLTTASNLKKIAVTRLPLRRPKPSS